MKSLTDIQGLAILAALCFMGFLSMPGRGLQAQDIPATAASATTAPQGGVPRIEVDPPRLDLGRLAEGTIAEFTYAIRNSGDGPLEIIDIKATCGCTDVEMAKRILAPGESAELTGQFNSEHRLGKQVKDIILTTNDPEHKSMELIFTAQVYQDIAVEPAYLMLGTILQQTGDVKRVRIRAWTDPPLEIKNIRVIEENQPLTVKLLSRTVDAREDDKASTGPLTVIDLEVKVPEGAPIAILNGKIQLETNNKTRPALWIPFQGSVTGDVFANPARVYFGAAEPGATLTKIVTLSSRGGQPFEIDSIEPGELKIAMKPLTEGKLAVHRVELAMTIPDDGVRRFRDDITVKIKHPTMDALGLQVTAIARLPRKIDLNEKINEARDRREQAEDGESGKPSGGHEE